MKAGSKPRSAARSRPPKATVPRAELCPLLRARLKAAEAALGISADDIDSLPASSAPDFSTLDDETINHWRTMMAVLEASTADLRPLSHALLPSLQANNSGATLQSWLGDRAFYQALDRLRRPDDVRHRAARVKANTKSARLKRAGHSDADLQRAMNSFLAEYPRYSNLSHLAIARAFLRAQPQFDLSPRTLVNLTRHPNPRKRRARR